ncbi:MAG: hypothetical protein IJY96_07425 [Oscillospiraceae bacterium]|nr:hypothetical protein [Oscillospiraceae bacterium]
MIELRDIRLAVGESEKLLRKKAAKALRIDPQSVKELKILKKSLDARKKGDIHRLYTVAVSVEGSEEKIIAREGGKKAKVHVPFSYEIPRCESGDRPVVVGFGPGGMFAALVLAEAGLRPIVLERGADVDTRHEAIERFWDGGGLCENANVQFGEGGAGTFSDGKLNTGTHDRRIAFVLRSFHRFGAPESICYDAKPYVGTDVLRRVVKAMREHIISLGGEVRFGANFVGFAGSKGAVKKINVSDAEGEYTLECSRLILAIGHSARDTFEYLHSSGFAMERKSFSMGARIEHKQAAVGLAQYGEAYRELPAADYKLNCRFPEGDSAYTFCMCPGGYVVAAASEHGGVCTNGMSYSGRAGENANAALLVTLEPSDFPGEGVLAGMYWQREIERRAYEYGGGNYLAPAQKVSDFLAGRASGGCGEVQPTYRPGVVWGDLREVLPEKVWRTMQRAIPELGKKAAFFNEGEAVLTAPETRSSSPVRILRGEDMCALNMSGVYPCGEGAGYAGGITSAAVDGMRCAEAVIASMRE